jgi:hypothetical protein
MKNHKENTQLPPIPSKGMASSLKNSQSVPLLLSQSAADRSVDNFSIYQTEHTVFTSANGTTTNPNISPIFQGPIASSHWKIRKKKKELDSTMNDFYRTQVEQCRVIEEETNRKCEELYNSIFYEIKWSNPTVSSVHGKIILAYCRHLIKKGSTVPFPQEADLKAWNIKCHATKREKICIKVKKLYLQLYRVIEKHDIELNEIQNHLLLTGEQLKMKKDLTLRWMMEKNEKNRKTTFFTIWDLCIRNQMKELKVYIKRQLRNHRKMKEFLEKTSTSFVLWESQSNRRDSGDDDDDNSSQGGDNQRNRTMEDNHEEREDNQLKGNSSFLCSSLERSDIEFYIDEFHEENMIRHQINDYNDLVIPSIEERMEKKYLASTSLTVTGNNLPMGIFSPSLEEGTSLQQPQQQQQQQQQMLFQSQYNQLVEEIVYEIINEKDPDFGCLPLHYACKYNHFLLVKFLLLLGGNPTLTSPDGRNALHFAAAYSGNKDIIHMLLSNGGVNPIQKDFYQCTPLDLAKQNNNKMVIPLLLKWISMTDELFQIHEIKMFDSLSPTGSVRSTGLLSLAPEEYSEISKVSFQQMTPKLKLLINRLNGLNPFLLPSPPPELTASGRPTSDQMLSNTFSLTSMTYQDPTFLQMTTGQQQNNMMEQNDSFATAGQFQLSNSLTKVGGTPIKATAVAYDPGFSSLDKKEDDDEGGGGGMAQWLDEERSYQQSSVEVQPSLAEREQQEKEKLTKYLLELRLCSKTFVECIQENFIVEGIQLLKRRWILAKRLYYDSYIKMNQKLGLIAEEFTSLLEGETRGYPSTIEGGGDAEGDGGDSLLLPSSPQEEKEEEIQEVVVDLEKLALEFYKTATSITYEDGAESYTSSTRANRLISSVDAKYGGLSASAYSTPFEEAEERMRQQQQTEKIPSVIKISDKLYVEEEERQDSNSLSSSTKENPEYLLKIIAFYVEKERIEKLKDYSLRYGDHLSLFPILNSKFSSTISFIEENSMSLSSVNLSSNYFIFSKFIENKAFSSSSTGSGSIVGSTSYYVSLGYDLVEVHVLMKEYIKALLVLEEVLFYRENTFLSLRILFLLQKADLLLYLFDHCMEEEKREMEAETPPVIGSDYERRRDRLSEGTNLRETLKKEILSFFFPSSSTTSESHPEVRRKIEEARIEKLFPSFSKNSEFVEKSLQFRNISNYLNENQEFVFHYQHDDGNDNNDDGDGNDGNGGVVNRLNSIVKASFPSFAEEESSLFTALEEKEEEEEEEQQEEASELKEAFSSGLSRIDSLNSYSESDFNYQQTSHLQQHQRTQQHPPQKPKKVYHSLSVTELQETLSASFSSSFSHWLLSSCSEVCQEILTLSYLLSSRYLIEPYSVALSLFYLGKIEERRGNYLQSWKYLSESSLIAIRSKDICFDLLNIMLEEQRVFLRYLLKNEEDYHIFSTRANEINSFILKLSLKYGYSYEKTKGVFEHNNSTLGDRGVWPYSSSSLRASNSQSAINITTEYSWISSHHYGGGGMNEAKGLTDRLAKTNELFSEDNSIVLQKIEKLWRQSAEYLAIGTIHIKDKDNRTTTNISSHVPVSLSSSTSGLLPAGSSHRTSKKKTKVKYL